MPAGGLWSRLAALHINFGFLPSALLGEALGIGGGCFGATIALRRAGAGADRRVRARCATNWPTTTAMGAAVRELGLATVLSPYIVENSVSETNLASLWRHELRWARTVAGDGAGRLCCVGGDARGGARAAARRLSAAALDRGCWFLAMSLLLRWGSAAAIARSAGPAARRDCGCCRCAMLLSFAVFLGSFCGRSVSWRDQLFRVEPSGRIDVEGDKPVMMKTLFLQPPSFDGFDGGAGSRYQAQARDPLVLVSRPGWRSRRRWCRAAS